MFDPIPTCGRSVHAHQTQFCSEVRLVPFLRMCVRNMPTNHHASVSFRKNAVLKTKWEDSVARSNATLWMIPCKQIKILLMTRSLHATIQLGNLRGSVGFFAAQCLQSAVRASLHHVNRDAVAGNIECVADLCVYPLGNIVCQLSGLRQFE